MKIGDYIRQENTNSTGLIIQELQNGSYRALVHEGWRGRVIQTSIKGWYPEPVVIEEADIPAKVVSKIRKEYVRRGFEGGKQ